MTRKKPVSLADTGFLYAIVCKKCSPGRRFSIPSYAKTLSVEGFLYPVCHLQNSTYPAARHTQNSITLKIDVEGISRIKNIPIAAQSKAKPIIRFIIKILTAVVTLTLSYALRASFIPDPPTET